MRLAQTTFLSQCNAQEIWATFPEVSEQPQYSYGATQLFILFPLCAVISSFHTTGCEAYFFTRDGYGIFDAHTNWVHDAHTKGGQAQTSLHKTEELTRRNN